MHSDPSSSEQFSSMESLKIDKFTYHGWQQDYHAIIQSQAEDEYFGVALRFGESNSVTRDRFLGMIHSQRLANGDRSHSQIALLDSIKASLTYPGHQKDIDHAERLHVRFPSLFQDQIPFMMRKQRIFQYGNVDSSNGAKRSNQGYPVLSTISSDLTETSGSATTKDTFCVICLISQRDYAFVPCGHLCICKDCAIGVANLDGLCPLCRCTATHIMRIFK